MLLLVAADEEQSPLGQYHSNPDLTDPLAAFAWSDALHHRDRYLPALHHLTWSPCAFGHYAWGPT